MLDCRASDTAIRGHAVWSAGRVRDLLHRVGQTGHAISSAAMTSELNAIAIACQAEPVDKGISLSGRIARMKDPHWWTRNVRRGLLLQNEEQEHAAGAIHRDRQCYVSDHASKTKAARRKANAAILENLEVINEDGEVFNLGDVAKGSVSNPAIRRAELMMRCRGFEDVAKAYGHEARFLTITTPSRFHRFTGPIDQQKENPKWDGSTQKQGQQYLSRVWAKIRAAWHRAGYFPYGFRVAEPHHDGCVHWHILLWMTKGTAGWFSPMAAVAGRTDSGAGVVGIAGRYAMQDSPQEIHYKNRTARFDCKIIKSEAGSATGYIAKYICKNVDGEQENGQDMGEDLEAEKPATEASKRVRDWASTIGIRQFQQIGGPSVTVWRELRRMREESTGPVQQAFDFEAPRAAADASQWGLYWVIQGGPDTPRKDLTLKPWAMEVEGGKYGDAMKRIMGVVSNTDVLYKTRLHEWTTQRAGMGGANAAYLEQLEWMEIVEEMHSIERRFNQPLSESVRFPVFENFGAQRPRTCVNNCTDTGHQVEYSIKKTGQFWAWIPNEGPALSLTKPSGQEIAPCTQSPPA